MDTRTNAIPIYRQDGAHPQALACAACEVRSQALFGVLDDSGLDRIHTQIASVTLHPDAPVYDRGTAGLAVFTIREGLVRFERSSEHGDRRIVRIAGRGDLIGQEALLNRPYGDDAVACTEVQLCRIPRALIDQLAQGRDELPRELMLRWQRALDAAEAWVSDLSTGPARRRLLYLLRRLAEHAGADDTIWLPRREEIGAMLDMTIETASRLVSALRREGVLTLLPGRSAVLDRGALRKALLAEGAA
ncbi:MAG: Crp/Fnr family transcriptional regulator [Burkholderiaceae bacterium]|nr:Crp/Fnr family transcriptional regulator [Burkholderiaceae bacterium]